MANLFQVENKPHVIIYSGGGSGPKESLLGPIKGMRDGKSVDRFLYYKSGKFIPEKDVFSDGGNASNWEPEKEPEKFFEIENLDGEVEKMFALKGNSITIIAKANSEKVDVTIKDSIISFGPMKVGQTIPIKLPDNIISGISIKGNVQYILSN